MRLIFLAVLLSIPPLAQGQAPATAPLTAPTQPRPVNHSVSLDVHVAGSGGASSVTRAAPKTSEVATTSGDSLAQVSKLSEKQESKAQTHLEISVHNLATSADTVHVEWYFTAVEATAPNAPSGKESLFDHGAKDVAVAAGTVQTFIISSKEAVETLTRKTTSVAGGTFAGGGHEKAKSMVSGTKMRGWFVRLTADDRILAVRGSSQTYEDIGKDQTKVAALAAGK